MAQLESLTLIVKLLFVTGVIAALAWFVVRPMFQVWGQQPDPEAMMPKLPSLPEEELQIPIDPSGRPKPNRAEMLKQLREDPRQTALLLQHAIRQKDKERTRKSASKG